jgi:hypothetical protein
MTDERIKAVFEEYGQFVTGKDCALIQAIAEAVTPQRTWVGLTGLEQKELMAMSARDAVFATEAKLKEKNT